MNLETVEQNEKTASDSGLNKTRRLAGAKSRMRKCWKLLRARRRSAALAESTMSSYHVTDRNQMCAYVS
jgi:hypothetical protein